MIKIFLTSGLIIFPLLISAQAATTFLVFGSGPTAYRGDLQSGYEKWSAAFHVGVKLNNKKRLNGNLLLGIGSVNGQNIDYNPPDQGNSTPTPNTFFKTSFVSLHYELHFHIIKKEKFIVFLSQGFGLIRYNPKDQFDEDLLDQPDTRAQNESFNNSTIMLPFSLGASYFLPNQFGVGIQVSLVNPVTDYIDNISDWGVKSGNDNVIQIKLNLYAPLSFKKLGSEN